MNHQISKKLFQKAQSLIVGGVNSPVRAFKNVDNEPFFVNSAKGSYIYDVDENKYIDFIGTWGPAILGHAPQEIVSTVHETAKRGLSFGIPHAAEIEIASHICKTMPNIEKIRMVNSGTEATMSCVRLARAFTKRDYIIKFTGCYHGHVDSLLVAAGSGAVTNGVPDSEGVPVDLARLTISLPFNDKDAVREAFKNFKNKISAIILEPIPANAGLFFEENDFLKFLREITEKNDSLLIFDEVMTGFRVNSGGAQGIYDIKPDLTALGKIIGGGLPVGAFGGKSEIMDMLAPLGPVYQAGTLSGNPLAVCAGLCQLKLLEKRNSWQYLEKLGEYLEIELNKIFTKYDANCYVNRIASMFCIFWTKRKVSKFEDLKHCDNEKFRKFFNYLLNNGIYIAPSPYETGFLSTAHSFDDIDMFLKVVDKFFANH